MNYIFYILCKGKTRLTHSRHIDISNHRTSVHKWVLITPLRLHYMTSMTRLWGIIMKTKSRFSRNVYAVSDRIWCNKHLRHTTMENIITMGKVDTSYLIVIIIWAIDVSFQSPNLKWASWTYTYLYSPIVITQAIDRTSGILNTPPQDTLRAFTFVQCPWAVLHNDDNGRQ